MNRKIIKEAQDEVESIYFEIRKTNNILEVFSEFVEDEGCIKAADEETERINCICFSNRMPLFFSLLETAIEKNRVLQDRLEVLNNNLFNTLKENYNASNFN